MKLSDLLKGIDILQQTPQNAVDTEIVGISCDSRTVRAGDLFVCLRGEHTDGADYICDAILSGARACIAEPEQGIPEGFPCVRVPDARRALAFVWYNFYGAPAIPTVCVTGTCGKTSVAFMLRHILSCAGLRVGLMGTVRSMIGEEELSSADQSEIYEMPCAMTTPDPKYLYRNLRTMEDGGCDIAVMEASSHALEQRKLDPLTPHLSLFTNLTPEHLDYHHSMDSYLRSKSRLFLLSPRGILNGDDPLCESLASMAPDCEMKYVSAESKGDYEVKNITIRGMDGVSYDLLTPCGDIGITIPIPGRFTVENSSLAAAAAIELGVAPETVRTALLSMCGVEGRMEKIHSGDFTVIRDYAHTAAALESVLKTVRPNTEGRLITLFGCGGDRDRSKRAPMGECATRLSDLTVITSDNSRMENPISIIEQIMRGVHKNKAHTVIPNRREAILYALGEARPGDTVMLCGKGHETYEIDCRGRRAFDEKKIVEEFFEKNGKIIE